LLAQQLVAAGETVLDVPPTLSARVRLLDAGCTDKTHPHDAPAAAIVALRHSRLRRVTPVEHTAVLRLLADRHHDLTGLRTQAICRLHALLCGLTPGGAGRLLSTRQAERILHGVRRRPSSRPSRLLRSATTTPLGSCTGSPSGGGGSGRLARRRGS
jgi:hypothetical protein